MQNDIKYLVHIDGDDAFMRVVGKAGYLNCRSAGEFFNIVAEKNCKRLLIDLAADKSYGISVLMKFKNF